MSVVKGLQSALMCLPIFVMLLGSVIAAPHHGSYWTLVESGKSNAHAGAVGSERALALANHGVPASNQEYVRRRSVWPTVYYKPGENQRRIYITVPKANFPRLEATGESRPNIPEKKAPVEDDAFAACIKENVAPRLECFGRKMLQDMVTLFCACRDFFFECRGIIFLVCLAYLTLVTTILTAREGYMLYRSQFGSCTCPPTRVRKSAFANEGKKVCDKILSTTKTYGKVGKPLFYPKAFNFEVNDKVPIVNTKSMNCESGNKI